MRFFLGAGRKKSIAFCSISCSTPGRCPTVRTTYCAPPLGDEECLEKQYFKNHIKGLNSIVL